MKITIEGVVEAPSWEKLQDMIGTLGRPFEGGRLIGIARPDGNCNYRGLGVYELVWRKIDRREEQITLEVK